VYLSLRLALHHKTIHMFTPRLRHLLGGPCNKFSSRGLARILATDKVDPLCINIFKSRGHDVELVPTMPESELLKVIGNYDGLVVRSATKVTSKVLQAATKMRIVGRAGMVAREPESILSSFLGVGVDNIDVQEATKCGVMVMNTPDGNTISTAQLAMSLLCNMARKIPTANMSVKEGKWIPKKFQGSELQGKTIGIIGCGRIGQVVAKLSKTMEMKVVGYDPTLSSETLSELGIVKLSLENLLKTSDFITIHTPMTTETKHLLNDTTLALCKRGVGLVNCARGGIIDEEALLRALESGQVGSAALDVFTSEPPKENLKSLLQHPNLVCTPHLGASTEEAQINVARDIAQQMCDVFDQKEVMRRLPVFFSFTHSSSCLSLSLPLFPPTAPSSDPCCCCLHCFCNTLFRLLPASATTTAAVVCWHCQCAIHRYLYLAIHETFHVFS
jgi:D-3-phosphoglycerate dehydrogenase / 2-oxoglutarate reductase